jgi:cytoskeletal protein CcmA (bactofilin family)
MIKYLKNFGASTGITLSVPLIESLLFSNIVTISNTASSVDTTSGALIVFGGVGVGENLNVVGNIESDGNIKALNGEFDGNLTVLGYTTSNYVNVPGIITATTGNFEFLYGNSLNITGETITNSLEVINNANFNSISAVESTVGTASVINLTASQSISAAELSSVDLYVDNLYSNLNSQINFGNLENIRITGGTQNQVLGTDGNGNLTWMPGTGAISVGTGLRRDGDIISLSGTGFLSGVFNQVTIDQFGRVVAGTNFINNLEEVTSRGATTSTPIRINSSENSVDTNTGALIVAGGAGFGGTVHSQELVVNSNAIVNGMLTVDGQINTNSTVNFNATTVPMQILSGALSIDPTIGAIEFDGNSLYLTTNTGRQIIQLKNSQLAVSITFVAKAVAARNINILNATQYTAVGEDNWDDVILKLKDVVLLTSQTNSVENGLYIWNSENTALTRHPEFNPIFQGTIIFVSEGILYGGSFYKVVTLDPITVGSTLLTINEQFNADSIAISKLPKDTSSGLVVRSKYGSIALRQLQSTSGWVTITNPSGATDNIIISTSTVPVSSGGTGRTSLTGWMKGIGGSIQSTPTIPLADIAGAGTIASQNANAVSIVGGTINNVTIGNVTPASSYFTDVTVLAPALYSVYFDGTGDYLGLNGVPDNVVDWINVSPSTIEFWVNANSLHTGTILSHMTNPTQSSREYWKIIYRNDGVIRISYYGTDGNTRNQFTPSSTPIMPGSWNHIAIVRTETELGPSLVLYVNGIKVHTRSAESNMFYNSNGNLYIGNGLDNSKFNGYISNLRIVRGTAVYTSNFTPAGPLTAIPGTVLLTCQDEQFVDNSVNAFNIQSYDNIESSTLNPFTTGTDSSNLILTNYLTGRFRVKGDSSLNGALQVAGTIYEEGYAVLNENDIIDGGTY